MSYRLGVVVLVALCAVSANAQVSQVLGYISQSFNLVRSDTLEVANYVSLANITKKDDSDVNAKAQVKPSPQSSSLGPFFFDFISTKSPFFVKTMRF